MDYLNEMCTAYRLFIFIILVLFINEHPFLFIALFFLAGSLYAQIAYQGFEQNALDTWPVTFSTPPCTNGADQWDYENGTIGGITASTGAQFWAIQDLNGNCGSAAGESITTSVFNLSNCTSVSVSFDYNAVGFDSGDDIFYELFFDGAGQGPVNIVNVGVGGVSTPGWVTETIAVPNPVN